MDQPIQPANEAELNVFLKAAEERFNEMGADPEAASQAFTNYLAKQAEHLGIQAPAPEQASEKQASADEQATQLALFRQAAVARFAELGIDEKTANAYLDAKVAQEQSQPSEKVVKIANHLKSLINK